MHKASRVLTATAVPLWCVCRAGRLSSTAGTSTRLRSTSLISSSSFTPLSSPTTVHQQQFRHMSTRLLRPLPVGAVLPAQTSLWAAVRTQHAGGATASATASAAAEAESAAHATVPSEGQPPQPQPEGGSGVHIDPRRLPSTIPGISQEELAARITAYHTKKAHEASVLSNKALSEEVELMRRSLSPNDFAAYMQSLEKGMAAAAKEQAKLAAMSPVELHQYQQKKKRQAVRYEWYKTFLMIFALVGSTALLFSLFVFFK